MTDHNHCDDKSSNSNCECQCVETLAKILKCRKGDIILLFEKDGAQVVGKIKDVVNNSVLILGPISISPDIPVLKTFCTCEGTTGGFPFTELVVSICEITEFGSISGGIVPKIEPATKGWFKKWF
ncbi:hypothetical protein [Bacillus proteolyticus]|uniref:hypothetical protein n=1 Tax=Bacillus proteolyticus TaxID=2026192 RepID=UPI003D011F80